MSRSVCLSRHVPSAKVSDGRGRLGFMLKKKGTPGNVDICNAAIKEV